MNNKVLVITLISMLLLSSIPMVAFAPQPPVDPNTLVLGTLSNTLPRTDPATSYDTSSCAMIMNVYEPLIDFDRDFVHYDSPDRRTQGRIDQFVPRLSEILPVKEVVILNMVALVPVDPEDPVCTVWEDVDHPGIYYHINGFRDNNLAPPPGLGFCDVVYMEQVVSPSNLTWVPCTKLAYHVEAFDQGPPAHLTLKRTWYIFKIRQGVKIHPWKFYNGTLAPAANLTCEDVEYYFERGMVQDRLYGPFWMLYKPVLDAMNGEDGWNLTVDAAKPWQTWPNLQSMINWIRLIECSFQHNDTYFKINVCMDFPETAFYQILAQPWGYIVPRAFSIDHGCWDGSFFNASGMPHAVYYWRNLNGAWMQYSRSPLDRAPTTLAPAGYVGRVPPPSWDPLTAWAGHAEPARIARGTGPYKFTSYNPVADLWRIDKFDEYWQGWPTGVDPHRYYVNTYIVKAIADWPTRKMAFLKGEIDLINVPRAYMYDLLYEDPPGSGNWLPMPGIVCYKDIPTLQSDSLHFQFNVAAGSDYMPMIGGVNQSDFFSNVYARRAFAYALNFTQLLEEAWFNEAEQPATWHISGLAPDYRDLTIKKYDINTTRVEEELKAAIYDGTSLWDSGFFMNLVYNEGNDQRRIVCEMIEGVIESFNAVRTGPDFVIDVVAIDYNSYWNAMFAGQLPFWEIGWLADFADADNWVRPYMHSYGDFSFMQGYSNSTVDVEIDLAVKTPDGPERQAIYYDLQRTFINECPTLMIAQPYGRAWMRDWVQGWYYNPLYPGEPIRDRWKGFLEDFNHDMKINIGDLIKLMLRFGHTVPPEDPIYDLNKDGKIDLLDFIKCAMKFGAGVP